MLNEPMFAEDLVREIRDTFIISRDAAIRLVKERDNATAVCVMDRILRERDLLRTATEPLTACNRCRGNGVLLYGSGATYRRGPGGAVMKLDICNRCWGSGIKGAPWHDLRAFSSVVKERDEALAEVARLKEALDKARAEVHEAYAAGEEANDVR